MNKQIKQGKHRLTEAKKDLELAVSKALCDAPLSAVELKELSAVTEADLMLKHGCDIYMSNKVKMHVHRELFRHRAQDLFIDRDNDSSYVSGYPERPYTATSPISESKQGRRPKLNECPSDPAAEDKLVTGVLYQLQNNNAGENLKLRLGQYIGMLRAMQLWFHGAHHVTRGTSFAGDHVNIFGRIYTDIEKEIDGAIEKAVGLTRDEGIACPTYITELALQVLRAYPSPPVISELTIAATGLEIENNYLSMITEMFKTLEASNELSLGLNDFLAASANLHESHVYLLQQRVKSEIGNAIGS